MWLLRYLESTLHLRYDAGCRATHLYAQCSEGCVVWWLRRYLPVMAELSFLRSNHKAYDGYRYQSFVKNTFSF
jgi:hypothetical protein